MEKVERKTNTVTLHLDPKTAREFDRQCKDLNQKKGKCAAAAVKLWCLTPAEDQMRILANGAESGLREIIRDLLPELLDEIKTV